MLFELIVTLVVTLMSDYIKDGVERVIETVMYFRRDKPIDRRHLMHLDDDED